MPNTQNSTDAIIIGGGHNGLVCAYYLASKGLKVDSSCQSLRTVTLATAVRSNK